MMRKPIFTGIAAILALALTAGLAYGAGRLISIRNDASHTGRQDARIVPVQLRFRAFNGATFRHQTRRWMRNQFAPFRGRMDFAGNRRISGGRDCDPNGCSDQGTSYRGNGYQHRLGYQGGSPSYSGGGYHHHSGYHGDHRGDHRDSGSWGGGNHGGRGSGHHGGCCGW